MIIKRSSWKNYTTMRWMQSVAPSHRLKPLNAIIENGAERRL